MDAVKKLLVIPTDTITLSKQEETYTNSERYLWIDPEAKHTKFLHASPLPIFLNKLGLGVQYVPQFAYYPATKNAIDGRAINLLEVIKIMRGTALRDKANLIKQARDIGDHAKKNELKLTLPYITHSGIFIPRKNEFLIQAGFTFQLDIDNIPNADEILQSIIADKNLDVLIATKSVSGNGVKAILFIRPLLFLFDNWSAAQYRDAFHKLTDLLERYFTEKHRVKIDTQMKAISQPFFLFHSPDLYIHPNFKRWI